MRIERIGQDVRVSPDGPLNGEISVPGSKSQTQRMLICAALADGGSTLRGALLADDTRAMADGLQALGISVRLIEERSEIEIEGCRGHIRADQANLNTGPAGTAMRFLTALACLGHGPRRIDGSQRMRQRPIGVLVDALHELGADIGYEQQPGYPPLTIMAHGLTGGEVVLDSPQSSQFVSAILMAAPYAARDVMIRVDGPLPSRPYVDLTLDAMRSFGVEVLEANGRFIVPSWQHYVGGSKMIEPDASSATYFFAAAAVTGGRARVRGLSRQSRQGDVAFVDVLERMGARVGKGDDYLEVRGPPPGQLTGVTVDLNAMPDTVQTLAVVALFAQGPTEIRNVANLRVKETDRLAALAAELARLDAKVDLHKDGLTVYPPQRISPAEIHTYDDHRMAMSFAIAGLVSTEIVIKDAGCVSKSFPGFFDELARIPAKGC